MPANTHYRVITIICLGLLSDEQPTVSSSIQFDDPRTYLTTVRTSTISSSLSSFSWGFLMCMSTHTLSTIGPDTPDHLIAFFSSLLSRDNFWHRVAIQKDVNKNSTCSIKQGMLPANTDCARSNRIVRDYHAREDRHALILGSGPVCDRYSRPGGPHRLCFSRSGSSSGTTRRHICKWLVVDRKN